MEHTNHKIGQVVSVMIGAVLGGLSWEAVASTIILTLIGALFGGVAGFLINKLLTYLWKRYVE